MPWNQPGQNDRPSNPWGGGNKNNSSPPDLDKLISDFFRKLRSALFKRPASGQTPGLQGPSMFSLLGWVLAVVLTVWFFLGFFIVNPAEQAVVLRFGKYTRTLESGLHWIPSFIEKKYIRRKTI